jgi:very-short-patch-repair endonuclease
MKTDEGVAASQRSRARTMRGAPTETEHRLWRLLRDRRLNGFKFRRRVPLGPYIVDFLCVGAKLIVEADGFQHAENHRDIVRDAYPARQGWKVLRFWNNEVFLNRAGVLETSWRTRQNPHPALRATFSPGEKGCAERLGKNLFLPRRRDANVSCEAPFSLGEKVSPKATDEGEQETHHA